MAKKKKKHHRRAHGQEQPKRSTATGNKPLTRIQQFEKSMQDIKRLAPYLEQAAAVAQRERVKKALEKRNGA